MKTLVQLFEDSKPGKNAKEELIRLFKSSGFDNELPDGAVEYILNKKGNWANRFGIDDVQSAWKELISTNQVTKSGTIWKYKGR